MVVPEIKKPASKMKTLIIVLDGVGDRAIPELKGKTALEAAKTPSINKIARKSKMGLMTMITEKIPPETEGGILSLFGYDPLIYNTGRGALEAEGMGIELKKGDLVARCNFATKEENYIIDTQAGRILRPYSKPLMDYLADNISIPGIEVGIAYSLNYRFLLFLHSDKYDFSDKVTNTHPGYKKVDANLEIPQPLKNKMEVRKSKPMDNSFEAKFTSEAINEFTRQAEKLLAEHTFNTIAKPKVNCVLTRGIAIKTPELNPTLPEQYGGRWICFGDTPAERGIAKLAGMDLIENLPEPFTDHILTTNEEIEDAVKKDMAIRLPKLWENWDKYDYFYFHFKGPDPFGHRNMPLQKKKIIESYDKHFFEPLLDYIDLENTIIAVTTDHRTVCSLRTHTADPVPLMVYVPGIKGDALRSWDEVACKRGTLGHFHATEFLPKLKELEKEAQNS